MASTGASAEDHLSTGEQTTCAVQASCGGCPTLHLKRRAEIDKKLRKVSTAFDRHGHRLTGPPAIEAGFRSNYRNRLRLAVVDGQATLFNQEKRFGCPALRPELWDAIQTLRKATSENPTLLTSVDYAEVRVGTAPGDIGLSLASRRGPGQLKRQQNPKYGKLSKILGPEWLIAHREDEHQPTLSYGLGRSLTGEELLVDVPIDAFVQVNSEVNELLVSHVRQVVLGAGHKYFVDLFAGAGNLSVPLLDAGLAGVAVERNSSAIRTLRLRDEGLQGRLQTVASDVAVHLPHLEPTDVVICNPPRKGIKSGYELIAALADMVICVSCDAQSLAHDAAELKKHGFKMQSFSCFDMFPGTDHIETVAVLTSPRT